jgi:GT2 family glycosyltransferase
MFDISIITVGHNHFPHIQKCLPSVFDHTKKSSFEYVLVDNVSSDGTAEWVGKHFSSVKIITNDVRRGFAENINRGLRGLNKSRYIVLINPDIICLPNVINSLVDFMDAHPKVGIAGPKLLNPDMTLQPSCRGFSTPTGIFIRGLHLDALFKGAHFMQDYLLEDLNRNEPSDVDWVTGAFMIVRRDAISEIGPMDQDRYFLYAEDQDWCCRMWRGGWRVCYVPQAMAIHEHLREGIKKPWSKLARYQWVSAFRMFQKFNWKLSRNVS